MSDETYGGIPEGTTVRRDLRKNFAGNHERDSWRNSGKNYWKKCGKNSYRELLENPGWNYLKNYKKKPYEISRRINGLNLEIFHNSFTILLLLLA